MFKGQVDVYWFLFISVTTHLCQQRRNNFYTRLLTEKKTYSEVQPQTATGQPPIKPPHCRSLRLLPNTTGTASRAVAQARWHPLSTIAAARATRKGTLACSQPEANFTTPSFPSQSAFQLEDRSVTLHEAVKSNTTQRLPFTTIKTEKSTISEFGAVCSSSPGGGPSFLPSPWPTQWAGGGPLARSPRQCCKSFLEINSP